MTPKLSKMTKKWLMAYLSFRVDITGDETKADLLHLCKILNISEDISPETFQKVNWRMMND
jgi:hypothetical protein